jgi:hypothetical protein
MIRKKRKNPVWTTRSSEQEIFLSCGDNILVPGKFYFMLSQFLFTVPIGSDWAQPPLLPWV